MIDWPTGARLATDSGREQLAYDLESFSGRVHRWLHDTDPPTTTCRQRADAVRQYLLNNYDALRDEPFMDRGVRFSELVFWLYCQCLTASRRKWPPNRRDAERTGAHWPAAVAGKLVRTATPLLQYSCAEVLASLRQLSRHWLWLDASLFAGENDGYLEWLEVRVARLCTAVAGADEHDLPMFRQAVGANFTVNHRALQELTVWMYAVWRRRAITTTFPTLHPENPQTAAVDAWLRNTYRHVHNEDIFGRFRAIYLRSHVRPGEQEVYARDEKLEDGGDPPMLEVLKRFRDRDQYRALTSTSNMRDENLLEPDADDPERQGVFLVQLVDFYMRAHHGFGFEESFVLYNWEWERGYWQVRESRHVPMVVQLLGGQWALLGARRSEWRNRYPSFTVAMSAWLDRVRAIDGRLPIGSYNIDLRPLLARLDAGGGSVSDDEEEIVNEKDKEEPVPTNTNTNEVAFLL